MTFIFSIEEGADRFEIEPLVSNDPYGYMCCVASVSASGFKGQNTNIWCDLHDLNRFFNELVVLEQLRQGAATLESMSAPSEYNELFFRVYSIDRAGHMAINVVLQKLQYLGAQILAPLKVEATFVFDPGKLPTIVKDFAKLLKFISESADLIPPKDTL